MALQHNLEEQLKFLRENLSTCHFAGFQYAPTASVDIEVPSVFNFDTQKTTNSRNCSKQSVTDVGYLDLQSFRSEQTTTTRAGIQSTAIISSGNRSKYTATVAVPVVQRKSFNLQEEISRFESAIPDSAFMDIDIDALVAAELAKSENSAANNAESTKVTDWTNLATNNSFTEPFEQTHLERTGSNVTVNNSFTNLTVETPSTAPPPQTAHTYPNNHHSNYISGSIPTQPISINSTPYTNTTTARVAPVVTSSERSALNSSGSSSHSDNNHSIAENGAHISNESAVKEAELQRVKQDMKRY